MQIAIDGHDLEGNRTGVGRYLMNILRSWSRSGAGKQHHITTFHKGEVPDDLPEDIEGILLKPLLGRPSTAVFTHLQLPQAAKRANADALFCPGYVAPMMWKKPFAVTLHDIIYEARPELFRYHSPADAVLLRRMSRKTAERADIILTPSHFSAGEIMAHYNVQPERIVVTPLAPDPAFTPKHDRAAEQRILQNFNLTAPFFLTVGTIQTRRHVPECISAFIAASEKHPGFQYLVAGGNQTDPHVDIEALIKDANTQAGRDAIVYQPYIGDNDLRHLYRAAHGVIWLSEYEGFGLPPLEAQASGTPVITSRTASLPEAVGECAVFVSDPTDAGSIQRGIEQLMADTRLHRKLEQCGPKHAKNFSWDACAQQTLAVLLRATDVPE